MGNITPGYNDSEILFSGLLPPGLRNYGNSCYMNAGLQFLVNLDIFSNIHGIIVNNGSTQHICRELLDILHKMSKLYKSNISIQTQNLYKQLQQSNPNLFNQKQQDAHEFIIYILEIIHNGTRKITKEKNLTHDELEKISKKSTRPGLVYWNEYLRVNNSLMSNLISGQFRSRINCLKCGKFSDTYEPFWDIILALPINEDNITTIGSCFRKFFEEQSIQHDNEPSTYKCSRCKDFVRATRCINISQFPKIMIVTLKRFNNCGQKCTKIVTFKTTGIVLKSISETGIYKLIGVIEHNGNTLFQGHYITYSFKKSINQWFKFDDEIVTNVKLSDVEKAQAYCLLYYLESKVNISQSK